MDTLPSHGNDAVPGHNTMVIECVVQAAARQQLPPEIVLAVLRTENGTPGMARANKNGSHDLGPMQINTSNLRIFSGYVTMKQIRYDVCANIHAGAWLLRSAINRAGGSPSRPSAFWKGVGYYHSSTPGLNSAYQQRVAANLPRAKRELGSGISQHFIRTYFSLSHGHV